MIRVLPACFVLLPLLYACNFTADGKIEKPAPANTDTIVVAQPVSMIDSAKEDHTTNNLQIDGINRIDTKNVTPEDLVSYAETLMGTPYQYAATDPSVGFDCSGFITYVFNHFDIAVPRSSIDFTNVPKEVPLEAAKRGDIILFTGTDSTERLVGHMGIITTATDTVRFIHSTSGSAYGVTVTPLNTYYRGRFVKVIRLFPQNDGK